MLNKCCISFLVFFFILNLPKAQSPGNPDAIFTIVQVKDKIPREKLLVNYIKNYFVDCPANKLAGKKTRLDEIINKADLENKQAFDDFTESSYQEALLHPTESEQAMIAAIQSAGKNHDDYLLYAFMNFLAYKQTEKGDVIGAVSSYRMAKKEAIKLADVNLQLRTDVNISDVFYKNSFYSQSLFYLGQAQAISATYWPDDLRIKNVIYYNKSENFFRMDMPDSLKVYNQKLKASKANTFKLYTYKNRTDYYLYLLHHDYSDAIKRMEAMQKDGGYKFDNQDLQNLADAYYNFGRPDSAKNIINRLLSSPSEANHPEIKYHLYDVLGKIAEEQGDYKAATANFKASLQQSEYNMNRLTQVDNISSLIKVDEVEGYYSQKNETYQKERIWLIIAVIFAIAIIVVITLLYRAIKLKRHFEKLLFAAKRQELSFINSHDVRKHLTNILGLMEVIKRSENKGKEYLQAEDHLFHSSCELDKAIKTISEKLDN